MSHGIHANVAHRELQLAREGGAGAASPRRVFVPVTRELIDKP